MEINYPAWYKYLPNERQILYQKLHDLVQDEVFLNIPDSQVSSMMNIFSEKEVVEAAPRPEPAPMFIDRVPPMAQPNKIRMKIKRKKPTEVIVPYKKRRSISIDDEDMEIEEDEFDPSSSSEVIDFSDLVKQNDTQWYISYKQFRRHKAGNVFTMTLHKKADCGTFKLNSMTSSGNPQLIHKDDLPKGHRFCQRC